MLDVMKGAAPFVITMFAIIALLPAFPQTALWVPSLVN
jgi:TRAP-type C4-dicarboxylate transport system permease large subunit